MEKMLKKQKNKKLPKIGMLYLDYVLRFFDKSNFRGWPDKIETVTYHWKNDKARFIKEVKRKKILSLPEQHYFYNNAGDLF